MAEKTMVLCDAEELKNIADALRENTGGTETYSVSGMTDGVKNMTPDQIYDPTSRKAQSGQAVAGAINEFSEYTNVSYSNTIKDDKVGCPVIIDNISPVEHELEVTIRGKDLGNVFDEQHTDGLKYSQKVE